MYTRSFNIGRLLKIMWFQITGGLKSLVYYLLHRFWLFKFIKILIFDFQTISVYGFTNLLPPIVLSRMAFIKKCSCWWRLCEDQQLLQSDSKFHTVKIESAQKQFLIFSIVLNGILIFNYQLIVLIKLPSLHNLLEGNVRS